MAMVQRLKNHYYSFSDNNPFEGKSYYRLKQIDYDGTFTYSNVVSLNIGIAQLIFLLNKIIRIHLILLQ